MCMKVFRIPYFNPYSYLIFSIPTDGYNQVLIKKKKKTPREWIFKHILQPHFYLFDFDVLIVWWWWRCVKSICKVFVYFFFFMYMCKNLKFCIWRGQKIKIKNKNNRERWKQESKEGFYLDSERKTKELVILMILMDGWLIVK